MTVVANKRSLMSLYSEPTDLQSHCVRIVIAEKALAVDIIDLKFEDRAEELLSLNPYQSVPTLVDKNLVLYQLNIILEYLDERFPHPPLMPVYPVARAETRLRLSRIEKDLFGLYQQVMTAKEEVYRDVARQQLRDSLITIAPAFKNNAYFLSDDLTLVDCCLSALLWRLSYAGIELPNHARAVTEYAQRMFERETFYTSLSSAEHEMLV
ncbi:MAG: sspA [Gammaproteobacteria bacterium]|nr:sspA [Gammaproteobacteria bacterium]